MANWKLAHNHHINSSQVTPTLQELRDRRRELLDIFENHGAFDVKVFGSVARGQASDASDVDFLIDYDRARTTAWFPGGLINDLESVLACKVDITTVQRLSPLIAQKVRDEAIEL